MSTPKPPIPPDSSDKDNKAKSEKNFNSLAKSLSNIIGTFLDFDSLKKVSTVSKASKGSFETPLKNAKIQDRKKRISTLVATILQAKDYVEIQTYISLLMPTKATKSKEPEKYFLLERVPCVEQAFSQSQDEFITLRTWKSISPLEAAAWTGNHYALDRLLEAVPDHELPEALTQVKHIVLGIRAADSGEAFLAPYHHLVSQYDKFNNASTPAEKREQIPMIAKAQASLPRYALQAFFLSGGLITQYNDVPYDLCKLSDGTEFDIGMLKKSALVSNGETIALCNADNFRDHKIRNDGIFFKELTDEIKTGFEKLIDKFEKKVKLIKDKPKKDNPDDSSSSCTIS